MSRFGVPSEALLTHAAGNLPLGPSDTWRPTCTGRSWWAGFRLGDRLAAGDGEHLCGDVAGLLRGEEDVGRRDLRRLPSASQWCALAMALRLLRRHSGRDQRGPDRAWRDCVHPDALLRQLLRKGLGEVRSEER